MAIRGTDVLGEAMIATEKEIAAGAWDESETGEAADPTGDRSLEEAGEGLEGQHEPDADAEEDEGSEAESEEEGEGEPEEGKTEGGKGKPNGAAQAEPEGERKPAGTRPEGEAGNRVLSGKLREANERARSVEAERDGLKGRLEEQGNQMKMLTDQVGQLLRQVTELRTAPRPADAKPAEPGPEQLPDPLENPAAFAEHLRKGFKTEIDKVNQELRNTRFQTSLKVAHARHGDLFTKAFEHSTKTLNPQNPEDIETGRRIFNSDDPGEALVTWFKRQQTLAEVGDDPGKFRERIQQETREALMKDPEFRKQLLESLRAEAGTANDGRPRHQLRIPPNLNGAAGRGAASEVQTLDGSDQGVADSAWR